MRAMPREPEEARCEIKGCKRVGITGRNRASLNPTVLLCQQCACVWDMATYELMDTVHEAIRRIDP